MTTCDGFFSQQTTMTNYVVLEDEEPTKVNPEISPEEEERLRRQQQQHQQQYTYSESEESRPPSYRSRRASSSYNDDFDSDDDLVAIREVRAQVGPPLLPVVQPNVGIHCQCANPQCIACVVNGNAHRAWKRNRKCGNLKKKGKLCLHLCVGTFTLLLAIVCLAGLWVASRPIFSTADFPESDQFCPMNRTPENHQFKNFTIGIDFSSPSFTLQQIVHDHEPSFPGSYPHLGVSGDVQVRNAESETIKENEILVNVDVWMSDPLVSNDVHVYAVKEGIIIESNRTRSTYPPSGRPYIPSCVQVVAVIILPKGSDSTKLDFVSILTETLNIGINSDVRLTIDDKTSLKSVTGNIHSDGRKWHLDSECGLRSRRLSISSISGNIRGDWGLGEVGMYETRSGTIDIGISPLPSFLHSSNETLLSINTVSGSITINPILPPPDVHSTFPKSFEGFRTCVSSTSGNIDGQFFLGSKLTLNSISGRVKADIIPILTESKTAVADFTTDTKNGNQFLRFLGSKGHGHMPPSMTQSAIDLVEEGTRIISDFLHRRAHMPMSTRAYSLGLLHSSGNRARAKFPNIRGVHKSISGGIIINYPQFYEGTIHTSTISGRMRVDGDVEIIRDIRTPGLKKIEAVKGNEYAGFIETSTISGDIQLEVGHPRLR